MTEKMGRDDHEPAPVPARIVHYDANDYYGALEQHYQQNPNDRGNIFIVLLPKGGKFKLENTSRHFSKSIGK
jgi:hypothetical protein